MPHLPTLRTCGLAEEGREGGKEGGNAHTPQLRTIDTRPPSLAHNVSLSNSSGGIQQVAALTLPLLLEMQLIPSRLGQIRLT